MPKPPPHAKNYKPCWIGCSSQRSGSRIKRIRGFHGLPPTALPPLHRFPLSVRDPLPCRRFIVSPSAVSFVPSAFSAPPATPNPRPLHHLQRLYLLHPSPCLPTQSAFIRVIRLIRDSDSYPRPPTYTRSFPSAAPFALPASPIRAIRFICDPHCEQIVQCRCAW